MQQQERDLISGLFDRLKPFESQPRDGEAESFIKGLAVQQPAAPVGPAPRDQRALERQSALVAPELGSPVTSRVTRGPFS